MKDQHRATPEQWQDIKAGGYLTTCSTIHELLCRIEALEATQHAHIDLSHLSDAERKKMAQELSQPCGFVPRWSEFERRAASIEAKPNHPEIPGGSLKERISSRMIQSVGFPWEVSAASVLVEIAAWLREHYYGPTATSELLEQEAKR